MELPELLRTQSHMDSSPGRKLVRYKENPDQLGRAIRKQCNIEMAEIEQKLDDSRSAALDAGRDWIIEIGMLNELRNINERCSKYKNIPDTPVEDEWEVTPDGDIRETKGETKGEGSRRTRRRGRRHRHRRGKKTRGRKGTRGRRTRGKTHGKKRRKTRGKKRS
jgi:hypothetical protein